MSTPADDPTSASEPKHHDRIMADDTALRAQDQTLSFLDLPPEIRNQIYDDLRDSIDADYKEADLHKNPEMALSKSTLVLGGDWSKYYPQDRGFQCSCRTVHSEYRPTSPEDRFNLLRVGKISGTQNGIVTYREKDRVLIPLRHLAELAAFLLRSRKKLVLPRSWYLILTPCARDMERVLGPYAVPSAQPMLSSASEEEKPYDIAPLLRLCHIQPGLQASLDNRRKSLPMCFLESSQSEDWKECFNEEVQAIMIIHLLPGWSYAKIIIKGRDAQVHEESTINFDTERKTNWLQDSGLEGIWSA